MNDQEITQKLDQMATKADVAKLSQQLKEIQEIVERLDRARTSFLISDHSAPGYQRHHKS